MGFQDISQILEIFVRRIFNNLVLHNIQETDEAQGLIVTSSLDTLNKYALSQTSCRKLCETPMMKSIVQSGQTQNQLLQDKTQFKQLGRFYKILSQFWNFDQNELIFEQNISQLDESIQ